MIDPVEQYALDLTCAQYGHINETLTPLTTYVSTRVELIKHECSLSEAKKSGRQYLQASYEGKIVPIHQIYFQLEDRLSRAVTEVPIKFKAWTDILKCGSEPTYHEQMNGMLAFIKNKMDVTTLRTVFDFKLSTEMMGRLMDLETQNVKDKVIAWGESYRGGPDFVKTLEAVKAQQRKEKGKWTSGKEAIVVLKKLFAPKGATTTTCYGDVGNDLAFRYFID